MADSRSCSYAATIRMLFRNVRGATIGYTIKMVVPLDKLAE
jgi:hypothetical protein